MQKEAADTSLPHIGLLSLQAIMTYLFDFSEDGMVSHSFVLKKVQMLVM